ncbi:MAG: hypothetical protein DCF19_02990 [Pseudanabaena frigida]|uniref:HEPN AbiU2-like domain-containing protein n=1 Tax=Pseudanabaena frigida TaxID=945775 RepID=A0A2W4WI90_9CYAN|nr:MAG: hypothetical protein DCF19_02990 [Pseudanabaena frigida]
MSTELKLQKWVKWLEVIKSEVSDLAWSSSIYFDTREIIISNPVVNTGNRFYSWMNRNYVHATLMGIRRQLDTHRDAVSLVKLLTDMKGNYDFLTREQHLQLYSPEMKRIGNKTYDDLAGKSANVFPIEKIEENLQQLLEIERLHKDYVDRRIAHYDKKENIETIGTYQDLYDAVVVFEEIVVKYYLLLKATSIKLLPTPNYDWKNIFKQSWISNLSNLEVKDN